MSKSILLIIPGKIQSIGVSNFEVDDLIKLQNITQEYLSVVQNMFDPFNTDDAVREWCKKNDVAYMGHRWVGSSSKFIISVIVIISLQFLYSKIDGFVEQLMTDNLCLIDFYLKIKAC